MLVVWQPVAREARTAPISGTMKRFTLPCSAATLPAGKSDLRHNSRALILVSVSRSARGECERALLLPFVIRQPALMQSWLGICMLLAAGFGFCLARLKFERGKDGKLIAAAVLLFIGMIAIASRYTLKADAGDYQRTAVIDSWSGEQVATINRKHQDPPAE